MIDIMLKLHMVDVLENLEPIKLDKLPAKLKRDLKTSK